MRKVLIFSLAYLPFLGGAEIAIKEITDRFSADDVQFDMITLRFDSRLPKKERIGNITVYRIGAAKHNPSPEKLLQFPMYLVKIFYPFMALHKAIKLDRRHHYDTFWAMMAYMGFPIVLFRWFSRRVPYLLTLQEGDPISHVKDRFRIKAVSFLFKRVFTTASFIQAISTYLAQFARAMGFKGKLAVIPNAVDVDRFSKKYPKADLDKLKVKLSKQRNDIFLITTSRLTEKNAVDDIVRSLIFLPDHVKLLVLGTGPDERSLKTLVEKENLNSRVIFLGQIDHQELVKYLHVSDIFIRPSLSEGMGNSFVEAMAAKIPVIATPVGGIVDFLFDPDHRVDLEREPAMTGEYFLKPHKIIKPTGIFCHVRNPKSIAASVSRLLSDPALKSSIVENAFAMVKEKYTWDGVVKRMKEDVFGALFR